MHNFVASLLLALAAAALLSSPGTAPSSRVSPDSALLTTRAITAAGLVDQRHDLARPGDYFDLRLPGGLLLSVRLAALDAATAEIDAVVARGGRTLSEPSLRISRNATASIELSTPPLTLQFDVR